MGSECLGIDEVMACATVIDLLCHRIALQWGAIHMVLDRPQPLGKHDWACRVIKRISWYIMETFILILWREYFIYQLIFYILFKYIMWLTCELCHEKLSLNYFYILPLILHNFMSLSSECFIDTADVSINIHPVVNINFNGKFLVFRTWGSSLM